MTNDFLRHGEDVDGFFVGVSTHWYECPSGAWLVVSEAHEAPPRRKCRTWRTFCANREAAVREAARIHEGARAWLQTLDPRPSPGDRCVVRDEDDRLHVARVQAVVGDHERYTVTRYPCGRVLTVDPSHLRLTVS